MATVTTKSSKKKVSPANKSEPPKSGSEKNKAVDETVNMQAVRELLFGRQMEEVNQNLDVIEKRLVSDMERLRERVEQKLASLEGFIKDEMKATGERIDREAKERQSAFSDVTGQVTKLREDTDASSEALTQEIVSARDESRSLLYEKTKELTTALEETRSQLVSSIEMTSKSVSEASMHKRELANLFVKVGMELQEAPESE